MSQTSEGVARVLATSVETEAAALDGAIRRILHCAEVIALSAEILRNSFPAREQFSFEPQDSIIFASVDWYLKQGAKDEGVFANKNSKDFAIPAAEDHFAALNCKVLSTFADAVGRIQHRARGREP
ncbi:MAG: hypothetical protein ACREXP_29740 [Steroidobacteraceae bacterium]